MKRRMQCIYLSSLLALVSIALAACKTQSKPNDAGQEERPAGDPPPPASPTPAKVDVRRLDDVATELTTLSVGSQELLYIGATAKTYGDYFHYEVCPLSFKGECRNGDFLVGGALVTDLAAGSYQVNIAACVRAGRSLSADSCGRKLESVYQQRANASDDMARLIAGMVGISQEIKGQAPTIQKHLQAFRDETFGERPASNELEELIDTQLALGSTFTAALINGPSFMNYRRQFEAAKPREANQAPAAAVPDASSTPSLEEKWQAFLDQQAANAPAPSAPAPTPAPSDPDPAPSTTPPAPAPPATADQGHPVVRSVLISLGALSVVTGLVTAHLGYASTQLSQLPDQALKQYEPFKAAALIVDQAYDVVQNFFHDIKGTRQPLTEADLPPQGLRPPESLKPVGKGPSRAVYRNTANEVAYYIEGEAVYKNGSSLFEASGLKPAAYRQISAEDFAKLPAALQRDYTLVQVQGGSHYKLQPLFDPNYVVVGDKVYRTGWPELLDSFPSLSQDTINRIYERYKRLVADPVYRAAEAKALKYDSESFDPGRHYLIGQPLVDSKGRLIQPPDAWRVDGKNWFTADWATGYKVGERITTVSAGRRLTFTANAPRKLVPASELVDNGWVSWAYGKAVDPSIWKTELALRYNRANVQADLINMRQPVENWTKSLNVSATKMRRILMIGGGFLTVAGVFAVSLGVSMGLAAGPADALLRELARIEAAVAALHAQRGELWGKIKTLLGPDASDDLGEFWFYQL